MTPVPFDLPVRPSEAGELANVIFEHAEGKPLTDDLRNRLSARAAVLGLETIRPYLPSLERDPVHRSTYFVAFDAENGAPWLLHMAPASAPANAIYPKALLIGRMRRPNGSEIVVNASPFSAKDTGNVSRFAGQINQAFLPRPQSGQTAIAVCTRCPEVALPAAFDAFRAILRRTGRNPASIALPARCADPAGFYHAGLWAAIRAGFREGYSAGAGLDAIRDAVPFTRFSVSVGRLLVAEPIADQEEFERAFDAGERGWMLDEFARPFAIGQAVYSLSVEDVQRLALEFGPALKHTEEGCDQIRRAHSGLKPSRSFDFETVLSDGEALTAPRELVFWLHWLKSRGRAPQLVAPAIDPAGNPDQFASRLAELSTVAQHFQCTLSIHSETLHRFLTVAARLPSRACEQADASSGVPAETLEAIGRATSGRVNYQISTDLAGDELRRHLEWVAEHLIG